MKTFQINHLVGLQRCFPIAGLIIVSGLIALLAFFGGAAPLAAQSDELPLILHESTIENDFTTSLAWGDFDNDGDLDLFVGNGMIIGTDIPEQLRDFLGNFKSNDDRHNRLYCNDKGVLTSCWKTNENDFTTSVAWGDIEGDGDLDLAVGNACIGIIILIFPLPCTIPSGESVLLYRNQGFDADGKPRFDLIDFDTPPESALSVAWGDFDGDGRLDLATGHSSHFIGVGGIGEIVSHQTQSAATRVYHNDTIGNDEDAEVRFSPPANLSSSDDATFKVAWVDVDIDGDLDLAIANHGHDRIYCNQVESNGLRSFQPCWESSDDDFSVGMDWGNAYGDPHPEMVIGNSGIYDKAFTKVYSFEEQDANGNLTLNIAWQSSELAATNSVAWGDADGDGDLDLAVGNGNFGRNQTNRVYCNDGADSDSNNIEVLELTVCWAAEQDDITIALAWGDVDNDSDLDLAVGNISVPVGQQNRIYHNEGVPLSRSFHRRETSSTRALAFGDFDNDHDLDLVMANQGQEVLYCNRNGQFTDVITITASLDDPSYAVAWGDMDNDGDLDLIVGNRNIRENSGLALPTEIVQPNRIYRNRHNEDNLGECEQHFTPGMQFDLGKTNTSSVAWGDIDNDGDLDLAFGNGAVNDFNFAAPEASQIYRNDGPDAAGETQFTLAWSAPERVATLSLAWGDVDRDGDLDLALGNSTTPIQLYRNDGINADPSAPDKHLFTLHWQAERADDTHSIAWGDMNGDGYLDLAVGNTTQSSRVYCNLGKTLATTDCWHSTEAPRTRGIAWSDVDGDGDLDLALGNQEGSEQIFVNQGKMLATVPAWSSTDELILGGGVDRSFTAGVAWGDINGDGDLDLAVATAEIGVSGVYTNWLQNRATGRPFAVIARPDMLPAANDFALTDVITATTALSIPYRLFAADEQVKVRIFPEYSTNGGTNWQPATPGVGGDGTRDLTASAWPTGTMHLFSWNAANDVVSEHVIFRIRSQAQQTHSPIQWATTGSQSPLFRVQAPWFVRVVDARGQPVENALVYANGVFITKTNSAGLLPPLQPLPQVGVTLTALALVTETLSPRRVDALNNINTSDDWAYRVYLSTQNLQVDDPNSTSLVSTDAGEQRLTTAITRPLVLFNLVVSIEWSAGVTYTEMISQAMHDASNYLFDLTDGQMAIANVQIYDNAEHWSEADIHFSATNILRPHAAYGGILSPKASLTIELGRAWNGLGSEHGRWDELAGYRTIIHEFGHYALYLFDEYIGFREVNGGFGRDYRVTCKRVPTPSDDTTHASAMWKQYFSSELSDQGLSSLWDNQCKTAAHWQKISREKGATDSSLGESTWETIVRKYSDANTPQQWLLTRPMDRRAVLAGPNDLPTSLPDWPIVSYSISRTTIGMTRTLLVLTPDGSPADVGVALSVAGRNIVIDQGATGEDGLLDIYGSNVGDLLRASTSTGRFRGSLAVTDTRTLTMTLVAGSVSAPAASATSPAHASPFVRILPEQPVGDSPALNVNFAAQNFDLPSAGISSLTVIASELTNNSAQWTPAIYDEGANEYVGQITLESPTLDMNHVQLIGSATNQVHVLDATYRTFLLDNSQPQTLFSHDGNLRLLLNPNSFMGAKTALVISAQSGTPGPITDTLQLVSGVYDITAPDWAMETEKPVVLTLAYDPTRFDGAPEATALDLYWWDAEVSAWIAMNAEASAEDNALSVETTTLGTYVILARQP